MINSSENNNLGPDITKSGIERNLNNLNETLVENFPKIVDMCSENTEGYCNKINLSLNNELINSGINFKETYFKTMGIEMKV